MPRHPVCVSAQVLDDVPGERADPAVLPVLLIVARGEWNAMVNPAHPDAGRIVVGQPQPVIWDARLFAGVAGRAT